MRSRLVALVLVAAALAACGTDDDVGERPTPSGGDGDADPTGDVASLDGEWVVDRLTLDGDRVVLDPRFEITVRVDRTEIDGTAACNRYGGRLETASIGGGGEFRVSDLSWTEMGCESAATALEQAFLTVLQRVDSYEIADGVFVAEAGLGNGFHLTRVRPAEPAALTGTNWVLDTYLEGDAASNRPGMERVHLTFTDDGALVGATACSGIDGDVVLDGDRLVLDRLDRIEIPDLSDCDDGDAETSALVFGVLEGLDLTATIDGDRLTLESDTGGDDRVGLSFRPAEPAAAPPDLDAIGAAHDLDPAGGVVGPVMYAERIDGPGGQMDAEILGTLELDGDCLYTSF